MRTYRTRLILTIVCAALLAAGTLAPSRPAGARAGDADPDVTRPPTDTYLFVELWVEVRGSGTLPTLIVDFPGYQFNPAAGTLRPFFNPVPALHPSMWGFTGAGNSRSGAAGAGMASSLLVIQNLPYTTTLMLGTGATAGVYEQTRAAPVVLLGATEEGALRATIDGKPVTLLPGDSWSKTVGADLKTAEYDGRYDVISTVTNYGWQVRELIAGPTDFLWLPLAMR